jgi:oxygen-independent coproporphyrinogen-3 oxidase
MAYQERRLTSIYFGGGTPSLWGASHIARILEAIRGWFPSRSASVEVTLECNPGEARPELLESLREAGVNRLSLGLQSLEDNLLQRIDRRHSADQGIQGLETVLSAGFNSTSADLMFGLPGQSLERWLSDLKTVAATKVAHISLYHLTLESGTAMERDVRRGRVFLPSEEIQTDMWEAIEPVVEPLGFRRYEISNLARPGHASVHNHHYWSGRPYLGLGAGAHSFLPPSGEPGPESRWYRYSNRRQPASYMAEISDGGAAIAATETLDCETHLRERMFTGLRCMEGLLLSDVKIDLGMDPVEFFGEALESLQADRLIELSGERLRLTHAGLQVANDVFLKFF